MPRGVSPKHAKLVCAPMCDKPVDAVPGIGCSYAVKLKEQSICTAAKLYCHFLQVKSSECQWVQLIFRLCHCDKGNAMLAWCAFQEYNRKFGNKVN